MQPPQIVGTSRRVDIPAFRKGLDVPITGAPAQRIEDGPPVSACALIGFDHIGLKPQMEIAEGDRVKLGQPLFRDKRFQDVVYTAPAAGLVRAINRGPRRVLESVVIQCDDAEDAIPFRTGSPDGVDRAAVTETLLAAGLWTALRTRPYSKVPDPETPPRALFVTAMESAPLAADAAVVIAEAPEDFVAGVRLLAKLTDGHTFVCQFRGAAIPEIDADGIVHATFEGPHPAGLPGTHIHRLDPVNETRTAWHINYQDVMAVGALFRTGRLPTGRVVALAGPAADRPRLLRTRLGACTDDLVTGETTGGPIRVIAGDVLTGREAKGQFAYLGRFHRQITLMANASPPEILGWLLPSMTKFATARVHLRHLFGKIAEPLPLNTSLNGSHRAMIPVGLYEDMVPLDMLATQLLRAMLVMDTDMAQALGILELDEEDLALCTYICHSKYEYGMALRNCLNKIEAEG